MFGTVLQILSKIVNIYIMRSTVCKLGNSCYSVILNKIIDYVLLQSNYLYHTSAKRSVDKRWQPQAKVM